MVYFWHLNHKKKLLNLTCEGISLKPVYKNIWILYYCDIRTWLSTFTLCTTTWSAHSGGGRTDTIISDLKKKLLDVGICSPNCCTVLAFVVREIAYKSYMESSNYHPFNSMIQRESGKRSSDNTDYDLLAKISTMDTSWPFESSMHLG